MKKALINISHFRFILIKLNIFDEIVTIPRAGRLNVNQSCKSGRAFRVGFGPKVHKNVELNSGLRRTFSLRCTKKYSKLFGNIAKFFRPNLTFGFFRA